MDVEINNEKSENYAGRQIEQILSCAKCNDRFDFKKHVFQYMKRFKNGQNITNSYTCNICGRHFPLANDKFDLKKHVVQHMKKFHESHSHTESPEKSVPLNEIHTCNVCGRIFSFPNSLEMHKFKIHKEKLLEDLKQTGNLSVPKIYRNHDSITNNSDPKGSTILTTSHLNNQALEGKNCSEDVIAPNAVNSSEGKVISCQSLQPSLDHSKKEEIIKVACDICGLMLGKEWLSRHKRREHKQQRIQIYAKVKCPLCEKLISPKRLFRHLRAVHREPGVQVQCRQCGEKMMSPLFANHVKFVCPVETFYKSKITSKFHQRDKSGLKDMIGVNLSSSSMIVSLVEQNKSDEFKNKVIPNNVSVVAEENITVIANDSHKGSNIKSSMNGQIDENLKTADASPDNFSEVQNNSEYICVDLNGTTENIPVVNLSNVNHVEHITAENSYVENGNLIITGINYAQSPADISNEIFVENSGLMDVNVEYIDLSKVNVEHNDLSNVIHLEPEDETNIFNCEICGQILNHQKEFKTHMLKHDPSWIKKQIWKCDACSEYFEKKKGKIIHFLKHHVGHNIIRQHPISNQMIRLLDELIISTNLGQNCICYLCFYKSPKFLDVLMHLLTQHLNKENLKCNVCTHECSSSYKMRVHITTTHKKSKVDKSQLDVKTRLIKENFLDAPVPLSKYQLKLQEKKAREMETKVPCDICGCKIRTDWMSRHNQNVHKIGKKRVMKETYPKVQCQICQKKVSTKNLYIHMSKVHKVRGGQMCLVKCHLCGKSIASSGLDGHVRVLKCGKYTFAQGLEVIKQLKANKSI